MTMLTDDSALRAQLGLDEHLLPDAKRVHETIRQAQAEARRRGA